MTKDLPEIEKKLGIENNPVHKQILENLLKGVEEQDARE